MPWADRTRINYHGQAFYDVEIRLIERISIPPPRGTLHLRIREALFPGEIIRHNRSFRPLVVDYFRIPLRWMAKSADGTLIAREP